MNELAASFMKVAEALRKLKHSSSGMGCGWIGGLWKCVGDCPHAAAILELEKIAKGQHSHGNMNHCNSGCDALRRELLEAMKGKATP